MVKGVKKIWRWLRDNLFYVIIVLVLNGCASMNPVLKNEILTVAQYTTMKAACEKEGKDYKCESPMTNCVCIERVKPSDPAPIQTPSAPSVPIPVPEPASPTPTPKPEPTAQSNAGLTLNPGETLDLPTKNNSVAFYIKGLVQFNDPVNRDHIWFGWKFNSGGKEVNCHFDSVNRDTHFACQRFDGGCGSAKCERHDANPVEWNPATTYKITVTINPDYSVHAEAWDGDKLFAAWDNTVWTNPGKTEWVKVGNPFGYPMPGTLEVSLP